MGHSSELRPVTIGWYTTLALIYVLADCEVKSENTTESFLQQVLSYTIPLNSLNNPVFRSDTAAKVGNHVLAC